MSTDREAQSGDTEMWHVAFRLPAGQDIADILNYFDRRGFEVSRAWRVEVSEPGDSG